MINRLKECLNIRRDGVNKIHCTLSFQEQNNMQGAVTMRAVTTGKKGRVLIPHW